MDLDQRKLNKSEWDSIEIPVSQQEKDILNLIINGFSNVNIKFNKCNSIFTFLKIEYNEKMEDYLYIRFLKKQIDELIKLYKLEGKIIININPKIQIKSADKIRLENTDISLMKYKDIYEFVLLEHIENIIKLNYAILNSNDKNT